MLLGCYEGWEKTPAKSKSPNVSPGPSVPATKPFAYILFEPISLTAAAAADATCLANIGIASFKTAEWSERIESMTSMLEGLTDTLVTNPVQVGTGDCTKLAAIKAASLDSAPWGANQSPLNSTSEKKLVHLRAAFWDGEPPAAPPASVLADPWAGWSSLESGGLPGVSLSYFVLSHSSGGYFSQWSAAIAKATKLSGTAIDQVDPTEAGIAERAATIKADSEAMSVWLRTKA